MLVCPQCQFENPDDHKFCQKCGASLTDLVCPNCAAIAPIEVERCPTCGTITGVVLRAIASVEETADQPVAFRVYREDLAPTSSTDPTVTPVVYLDAAHRYQVLDPLVLPEPGRDVELRVLDRQPLQPPYLSDLQLWQIAGGDDENLQPSDTSYHLPNLAKPYLELQAEFHSSLPQLYDTWQDGASVLILLDDRSDFPPVSQSWSHPDTLILQILRWMHEMTELWAILEPYGAAASVLAPSNLRVDEDSVLCLQRLHLNLLDRPATLSQLGQLWLILCDASPLSTETLRPLCLDLANGKIERLSHLQDQLSAIANTLQSPMMPPSTLPPDCIDTVDSEDETAALPPVLMMSPGVTQSFEPVPHQTASVPVDLEADHGPTRLELAAVEESLSDGDDIPTVVLPMKLINIEDAGRSDVGRQREHNEDFFSIQTELRKVESPGGRTIQFRGIYILCDGMGGHASGEVASALAVDTLRQYFQDHWGDRLPDEAVIRDGISTANQTIFDSNQQSDRSGLGRMGTTLLMALVQDTQVAIAHVGDSRLYRFSRRRGLEQITVDHEVGQREIHRGVEPGIAYARPDAYQLTQALGPRDDNFVNPDVQFLEFNEDSILLLTSDGLTDNDLLEKNWRTHIEPLLSPATPLEQGVNQLIELANQYNGHDNITAIAIRVRVRPNLDLLKR